ARRANASLSTANPATACPPSSPPRHWWHARHTRIGKALHHEGRTVILTAPLVGGRALQLATATP
ncbi:hypothetical protein KDA82_02855, partial [Streptomyces daliensis]|nr:hypothetical protein [Streptomyces daliensis]